MKAILDILSMIGQEVLKLIVIKMKFHWLKIAIAAIICIAMALLEAACGGNMQDNINIMCKQT